MPGAVYGVEPDGPTIEDEADNVGQGTRAKAAAFGEMDMLAYATLEPLLRIGVHRNSGIATLSYTAAASGVAVGEVRAVLNDIEGATVGANDTLAKGAWHLGTVPKHCWDEEANSGSSDEFRKLSHGFCPPQKMQYNPGQVSWLRSGICGA